MIRMFAFCHSAAVARQARCQTREPDPPPAASGTGGGGSTPSAGTADPCAVPSHPKPTRLEARSSHRPARCARTSTTERRRKSAETAMAKSQFVRTKPHLNIGTMGHVDHGKTTLTAAITKVLADARPGREPVRRVRRHRPRARGGRSAGSPSTSRTSSTRPPPGTTPTSTCPGHADYVKNMITGAAQVDARDPGRLGAGRGDAADPRARAARRRVGVPTSSSRSTRPTPWRTPSCSTWSSWRSASC